MGGHRDRFPGRGHRPAFTGEHLLELSADATGALLIRGGEGQWKLLPVALDAQVEGLPGVLPDRLHGCFHRRLAAAQGDIADAEDAVAGFQSRCGCRFSALHAHHHHPRGWFSRHPGHGGVADEHQPGQQQVGQHSGTDHQQPLRNRTVAQQIRIIVGNLAVFVIVWEGDEPAEGQQA